MARRSRVRWGKPLLDSWQGANRALNGVLGRLEQLLTGIIVRANSGTTDLERTRLNFVDTAGATWTITDDPTNDEIKVELTASGASGAPSTAKYITQTPDAGLSAEQALSTLATGLVKNTTGTGVLSIGAAGTDYVAPGAVTGSALTMASGKLLGRSTALSGAIEEITVGSNLTLSAGTLSASGGSASATTIEVDLGSSLKFAGKFTITDAAIGTGSKVLCWQAPGPYTGKGTQADEAELAPVQVVSVIPAAGSASVRWQTPPLVVEVPVQAIEATLGSGTAANSGTNRDLRFTAQRLGLVRGNVKFSYMVM